MSEFGIDFTRYERNPLGTILGCDPWDAHGDPLKAIPGAAHPSVIHFPAGMDGYRFWMIFTPPWTLGSLPEGAPTPPIPSMGPDWYWERCVLVRYCGTDSFSAYPLPNTLGIGVAFG